jgi:hypothetical protein
MLALFTGFGIRRVIVFNGDSGHANDGGVA